MEHDIHFGCLGEYHVPWVDQSLYSPHQKSSIVYYHVTGIANSNPNYSILKDKEKNI